MKDQALESLLEDIRQNGTAQGQNLIAFSGGVDSTLVATLVYRVFPTNTTAVLGVSPSVSSSQLMEARSLAEHIGVPLLELSTREGQLEGYIRNTGDSCYHCKTTLYSTMTAHARHLAKTTIEEVVLFNGTNADDLTDPTRVGLQAAREFRVCSPLRRLSKDAVRQVSLRLELPNWDAAASPCLRSRLELGVPATSHHLQRIEQAERVVRQTLELKPQANLRVRHLQGDVACLEVDPAEIDAAEASLPEIRAALLALGFADARLRAFRSGGLSRGLESPFVV